MFNNNYFVGVTSTGYFVTRSIQGPVSDDEMLEFVALVLAMKPDLREKFETILKRIEEGQ